MGIPKKGSRALDVDGKKFRYIAKTTHPPDHKDQEELLITVQEDTESPGNVMQARLGPFEDAGPRVVADLVREALKQGWKPDKRGAAFQLKQAE
jgi:hypothetical protein